MIVTVDDSYVAAMRDRLGNYLVDPNGCHVWAGYVDRNGYGRVYDPARGGLYWVHVVAHEVLVGPVPPGHEVDHVCQNTLCIHPFDIEAVTRTEHVARTFRRLGKDRLHTMAAELRQTDLTYAEIADVLNLAGRESAHAAVQSAIHKGLVSVDDVPPAPRLTAGERDDIRDLYALGVPQGVLARCYGVDSSQVSRICSGRTSGHSTTGRGSP